VIHTFLFMLLICLQVLDYVFDLRIFEPDYLIYTHRKGWMHYSKATKQDRREASGMCAAYPRLD